MGRKGKNGGLAVALAILGMVAFVVICLAAVGTYWEVQTSKRISQKRMERVRLQIQEREAAEAGR